MPPNAARRTLILDAAIDILADDGIGGVTHRQIDERTGLPGGTTSNYFRSRLALVEATAGRVAELHWQHVTVLRSAITPLGRDGVAALMTRMVTDPDRQARRRQVARFELFLEGTRRPELVPYLNEMQSAALQSAAVILESAGLQPTTGSGGRDQPAPQRTRLQQYHLHRRPAGRRESGRFDRPDPGRRLRPTLMVGRVD